MLNASVVDDAIGTLSQLRFFPPEPSARAGIAELICDLCSTDAQVAWLAKRVRNLYDEWPGPHELRAVLCSKFKPKDGIEADSSNPKYVDDGIPSEAPERNAKVLGPPKEQRALTGEVATVSIDPELHKLAEISAGKKGMPKPSKPELERSRRLFIENGLEALCPKP